MSNDILLLPGFDLAERGVAMWNTVNPTPSEDHEREEQRERQHALTPADEPVLREAQRLLPVRHDYVRLIERSRVVAGQLERINEKVGSVSTLPALIPKLLTVPKNAFTPEQLALIDKGSAQHKLLEDHVKQAFGLVTLNVAGKKRHWYITSPPGAGKTFTVRTTAEQHNIVPKMFGGQQSIANFVIQTALVVYTHCQAPHDHVTMWIDDCDSFFVDRESLNIMKGVLDPDINKLTYNKYLTGMINQFSNSDNPDEQLQAEALRAYQPRGTTGVVIPTDRLTFVITSNRALAASRDVAAAANPSEKKMHESAIRDRLNYRALNFTPGVGWGWLASMLLKFDLRDRNKRVVPLAPDQKRELLCWMYDNWKRLPSASMRTVEDLALMMINHPIDYQQHWNAYD